MCGMTLSYVYQIRVRKTLSHMYTKQARLFGIHIWKSLAFIYIFIHMYTKYACTRLFHICIPNRHAYLVYMCERVLRSYIYSYTRIPNRHAYLVYTRERVLRSYVYQIGVHAANGVDVALNAQAAALLKVAGFLVLPQLLQVTTDGKVSICMCVCLCLKKTLIRTYI